MIKCIRFVFKLDCYLEKFNLMKKQFLIYILIYIFAAHFSFAKSYDETGFFLIDPPEMIIKGSNWIIKNRAILIKLSYDDENGSFLLSQVKDLIRNQSFLKEPSPMLIITDTDNTTMLDLSKGWKLLAPPIKLISREKTKGEGVMGADFVLESDEQSRISPAIVIIRVNIFPGDEPYITIEPFLFGRFKPKTHALMVRYGELKLLKEGEWKGFVDKEWYDKEQSFGSHTNLQTFVPKNGKDGIWVSIGNYNSRIKTIEEKTVIQAEANVYLDKYLPLTKGSLGTWMIGTYSGNSTDAMYDYQLFLIKRWIAGDKDSIQPHLHDYWYSTKDIKTSQIERLKKITPYIKESGFGFFWFIYDQHGVWPDWKHTPEEYFIDSTNVENPNSVAGIFAEADIPLGLYTAPCRMSQKMGLNFSLQHEKCREYGNLLGEKAKESETVIWWYEDNPGENYILEEDLPNQPKGNCSWMWRQGYMITRNEIRKVIPEMKICRTWVDPAEQLGWAEGCSCLDVYGSKGGNQSGGEKVDADLSLADNWRNAVWGLVPVWPILHHVGHHPVHIRDKNRKPSDTEYIDSSAAMMGPFSLNGPVQDTTIIERNIHKKWIDFNKQNREFLQFSYLPEFIDDPGMVDGIYHLANTNKEGLCGYIGLWNKDDNNPAEITLSIPLNRLRLRWKGKIKALGMNNNINIPIKYRKNEVIIGTIRMKPRDWQVIEIQEK